MKKIFIIVIVIFSVNNLFAKNNKKINVTFINPGISKINNPTGGFWINVSNFMKAAANDLNINLEILYSERNFVKMIKLGEQVVSRKIKPDYLILVNEKAAAKNILIKANNNGIKTFLILNDLTEKQKNFTGKPREKYQNWIGTLIPNNIDAGYKIAQLVVNAALKKNLHNYQMIAISGSRATPASQEREIGLSKLLKKYPYIKKHQLVHGEWNKDIAYHKTLGLLKRYPEVNIIWTANDPMAIGAINACEEVGYQPGENIFIGGLNWSIEACKLIKEKKLVTSVGGHFMVGGWALVILYDYHNKKDFIKNEGAELKIEVFDAIYKGNVNRYLKYFGDQNWSKINFKRFSKKRNPNIKKYNFKLKKILQQFK